MRKAVTNPFPTFSPRSNDAGRHQQDYQARRFVAFRTGSPPAFICKQEYTSINNGDFNRSPITNANDISIAYIARPLDTLSRRIDALRRTYRLKWLALFSRRHHRLQKLPSYLLRWWLFGDRSSV